MKHSWLVFFVLLLFDACLDRISIDIPSGLLTDLVVEGQITDEPGPYTVKLSSPVILEGLAVKGQPLTAKKVTIFDNLGNTEVLEKVITGTYQTKASGIRGIVGRQYAVRIETNDGKIVESMPDLLNPVGTLDSVYYEFATSQPANGPTEYGYNVYVDGSGLPNNDNFLRWRFSGTYVVETKPEYTRESLGNCPPCGCQVVPACSGWALVNGELHKGWGYVPGQGTTYIIGLTCTCCRCWVTQNERKPTVSSDQLVGNAKYPHVEVAFVPINFYTFFEKYRLTVEQMSLSRNAYDYWNAIRQQGDGTGSLFQPVTGKIPTNLFEATGTIGLQGIFYASSIKRKKVFIDKNETGVIIPEPVNCDGRIGAVGKPCYLAFPGATTQKPVGWD